MLALDMEKRVNCIYKDAFWFTLRKIRVSENKGRCLQTVYRDEQRYGRCRKRRMHLRFTSEVAEKLCVLSNCLLNVLKKEDILARTDVGGGGFMARQ